MKWKCKNAKGSDYFFQDVEFELAGEALVHKTTTAIYGKCVITISQLFRKNDDAGVVTFTLLWSHRDVYDLEKERKNEV